MDITLGIAKAGVALKRILYASLMAVCLLSYVWPAVISVAEEKIFKPQELPQAFAENPSEAKTRYMNKTVRIEGIVIDKGMSMYMTPYIELSESGKEPGLALCVFPYVGIAYWNRSEQISGFEQGQSVIIEGRVHNLSENRVLLKESKTVH